MIRITQIFAVSTVAVTLAACNSSSERVEIDPPPPQAGSAELRIHHTSADAPAVNVLANGAILAGLEGVDYQQSSPLLEVDAATYEVNVDGILPGGDTTTVIDAELTLEEDVRYEVFALGNIAGEGEFEFGPHIIAESITPVAEGEARLLVLHGAPVDIPVDVYLSPGDSEIDAGSPAFTISYKEHEYASAPEGEYTVTLTVAGDPASVLFTSPVLDLPAGADLVVTATLNTGANSGLDGAPIALVVSGAEGADVVYSTSTGADVRVFHAAADVDAVDIYANEISGDPAIPGLDFPEFTDYLNLAAGEYEFIVTLENETTAALSQELELVNGWQGTVFAAGELGQETLNLQAIALDNRRVATEARLRLIHASPVAGDVDIYVTETDDISSAEPAFSAVPFNAAELVTTGNVALAAGDYYVTITAAGSSTPALGPLPVELSAGGIYTAVAVGNDAESLGVVLMDDFESGDE